MIILVCRRSWKTLFRFRYGPTAFQKRWCFILSSACLRTRKDLGLNAYICRSEDEISLITVDDTVFRDEECPIKTLLRARSVIQSCLRSLFVVNIGMRSEVTMKGGDDKFAWFIRMNLAVCRLAQIHFENLQFRIHKHYSLKRYSNVRFTQSTAGGESIPLAESTAICASASTPVQETV